MKTELLYTYDAAHAEGDNLFGVWREMFCDLALSRELSVRLLIRDLKIRYAQTLLGYLWALLLPLVAVATFTVLNRSGILRVDGNTYGVPYPLYAVVGISIWSLFAGGLTNCASSLVSASGFITKIRFSWEALVFAGMGAAVVDLIVRAIPVAAIFWYYQTSPSWFGLPAALLALIPLILFTTGVGFGLALLNAVIRDVGYAVGMMVSLLMFLTPVVYPEPTSGALATLMHLNPLGPLVDAPRELLFTGTLSQPGRFAAVSILMLLVFFASWRVFHTLQGIVGERA